MLIALPEHNHSGRRARRGQSLAPPGKRTASPSVHPQQQDERRRNGGAEIEGAVVADAAGVSISVRLLSARVVLRTDLRPP